VDEATWLACADPAPMLEFLRGRASARKLRLFAVACCHLVWHWFPDPRSQECVRLAERFADGQASREELDRARSALGGVVNSDDVEGAEAAEAVASPDAHTAAVNTSWIAAGYRHPSGAWVARWPGFGEELRRAQAMLLREIVSNPFRAWTVDPSWLSWNGGTVAKVARAIYAQRRFQEIPVLADALEEAGCTDEQLLGHLRSVDEHRRGCFVLDTLLGQT
jgi:hypothetical protein